MDVTLVQPIIHVLHVLIWINCHQKMVLPAILVLLKNVIIALQIMFVQFVKMKNYHQKMDLTVTKIPLISVRLHQLMENVSLVKAV